MFFVCSPYLAALLPKTDPLFLLMALGIELVVGCRRLVRSFDSSYSSENDITLVGEHYLNATCLALGKELSLSFGTACVCVMPFLTTLGGKSVT